MSGRVFYFSDIGRFMPTVNQLIRKKRRKKIRKNTAPALDLSWNTLKNRGSRGAGSPHKRGVCVQVRTQTPKTVSYTHLTLPTIYSV